MASDSSAPLEKAQHEAFAQAIASGMSQAQAYKTAGYKSKTPEIHASQLVRNSKVQARIAYLKSEAAQEAKLERQDVVNMLLQDRAMAQQERNPTASISAANSIAKLLGFDRPENDEGKNAVTIVLETSGGRIDFS